MKRTSVDFMVGNSLEQRQAAYDYLRESGIDRCTIELLIRLDALLNSSVRPFFLPPATEEDAARGDGFRLALKALGIDSAIHRIATYDYFGGPVGDDTTPDSIIEKWHTDILDVWPDKKSDYPLSVSSKDQEADDGEDSEEEGPEDL